MGDGISDRSRQDGDGRYYPAQDPEYPGQAMMRRMVTFGAAIEELKAGKRVTRAGWSGRGMYLWLMPEAVVKAEWCREPHLKKLAEGNGGEIECLGSIRMFTINAYNRRAVLTGWTPSQSDMLAEDWVVLEHQEP